MNELEKIIKYAFRFTSLDYSKQFIKGAKKCMIILQGDDDYYWITTMADARVLCNNGYEVIR